MAIIAASDYKSYAGISGTTYDTRLGLLIPQLQDKVETYCRRLFDYSASYTEYVDGEGTDAITLKRSPINTVASVTVTYTSDNSSVLDSTDYTFSTEDDGRLWLYQATFGRTSLDQWGMPRSPTMVYAPRFPVGRRNITVVYAGGYGGAGPYTMPPGLQLAFMELLSEVMATSTAAGGGSTAGAGAGLLRSKTLGRNSEEYRDVDEAFAKFQERFYPYRRVSLG